MVEHADGQSVPFLQCTLDVLLLLLFCYPMVGMAWGSVIAWCYPLVGMAWGSVIAWWCGSKSSEPDYCCHGRTGSCFFCMEPKKECCCEHVTLVVSFNSSLLGTSMAGLLYTLPMFTCMQVCINRTKAQYWAECFLEFLDDHMQQHKLQKANSKTPNSWDVR